MLQQIKKDQNIFLYISTFCFQTIPTETSLLNQTILEFTFEV